VPRPFTRTLTGRFVLDSMKARQSTPLWRRLPILSPQSVALPTFRITMTNALEFPRSLLMVVGVIGLPLDRAAMEPQVGSELATVLRQKMEVRTAKVNRLRINLAFRILATLESLAVTVVVRGRRGIL
jgi:hypothetical protein